ACRGCHAGLCYAAVRARISESRLAPARSAARAPAGKYSFGVSDHADQFLDITAVLTYFVRFVKCFSGERPLPD
ncbi:MAG TPA: hypothetical protein VF511_02155, partial [Chthoniobacterales bacterium]